MTIRYVSDITKYTSEIKFPIFLHIQNNQYKIETEEKLIALIIRLYQRGFDITQLLYEEIEYVEFEEIITSVVPL